MSNKTTLLLALAGLALILILVWTLLLIGHTVAPPPV